MENWNRNIRMKSKIKRIGNKNKNIKIEHNIKRIENKRKPFLSIYLFKPFSQDIKLNV